MTSTSRPPFRADAVGSYLRTERIHEARSRHADGSVTDDELRAIEDTEILALIAEEQALGFGAVTDGEFRRAYWHFASAASGNTMHTLRNRSTSGSPGLNNPGCSTVTPPHLPSGT